MNEIKFKIGDRFKHISGELEVYGTVINAGENFIDVEYDWESMDFPVTIGRERWDELELLIDNYYSIAKVKKLVDRITMQCLGMQLGVRVEYDNIYSFGSNGRIFIQIFYHAPCVKTGKLEEWHGRKYYLSDYMTPDEIVKTVYTAFEAAVKHEIMEGFKVDGKILFNPHVNFEELLAISDREVRRN